LEVLAHEVDVLLEVWDNEEVLEHVVVLVMMMEVVA
jgi:hypothetical protein